MNSHPQSLVFPHHAAQPSGTSLVYVQTKDIHNDLTHRGSLYFLVIGALHTQSMEKRKKEVAAFFTNIIRQHTPGQCTSFRPTQILIVVLHTGVLLPTFIIMYEVTMVQLAARDQDKDSGLGIAGAWSEGLITGHAASIATLGVRIVTNRFRSGLRM
jgi:hypothetical protein